MSLTGAEVAEILKLLENSRFDELELELGEVKLSLRRSGAASAPRAVDSARAAAIAPPSLSSAAPVVALRGDEVTAPLLGTFYRAPKPGAAPFVEVGSDVKEDTVIAIIEVMKLMNTVRAGRRGRVSEILVGDGALVEFGQALIRIAP